MKSFQKKEKGYKSLQTKKCVHGRRSVHYIKKAPLKKSESTINLRQNHLYSHQMAKSTVDDPHSVMMKSIVAMNQDYFQNKLQVANDGKPSGLKLKIPSHIGFTIYKRDYIKNCQSQVKAKGVIPNFKQNKIKADFFGDTTYRNQFMGVQNHDSDLKKNTNIYVQSEAPVFLESQYRHNYLNWGSGSHMPSMKPHPNPAVTNLPFQTHTVYSTEFNKKPQRKMQNFKPNNQSGINQNRSNIISNQVSTPLLFMTTNNMFYDKKNNSKQNNLKPKTHTLTVGGNNFKGKTQYQTQFIKSKGYNKLDKQQKKPLQQLQNMILNL